MTEKELKDIPALPHSIAQLKESLERAEENRIARRFTLSENVFRELRNEFPFLYKSYGALSLRSGIKKIR